MDGRDEDTGHYQTHSSHAPDEGRVSSSLRDNTRTRCVHHILIDGGIGRIRGCCLTKTAFPPAHTLTGTLVNDSVCGEVYLEPWGIYQDTVSVSIVGGCP